MRAAQLAALARSASARFFAVVFVLQLVASSTLLLFVRHASADELTRQSRTLVSALRDDLVADWREEGAAGLARLIEARLRGPGGRDAAVLLDDPDGNHIAGNLADWPPPVPLNGGRQVLPLYRLGHAAPEQIAVLGTVLPDGTHLLVGHVVENDLRVGRLIGEAMAAALLLAIPLALIGAIVATRVVTARVERIADAARRVSLGDLTARVPTDRHDRDAFATLAAAINAMLVRIETLVSELRIVTDALAHDLRSPLTRLRATIERAGRDTRDDAALAALDRVAAEADTLLAMLTTALQISRAEAGIGRDRFVPTDLRRLIDDLIEMYGPLAEERGFALSGSGAGAAAVHRELIGQALANLVDNAMKHGAMKHDGTGGAIRVSVAATTDGVRLAVDDAGPGIPEDRRAEALRRFGRLDPARGEGGAGLGLALAAAVARLHGGTITLGDNAPGLSVAIDVPGDPLRIGTV